MINKNFYRKTNDKKILHKVGKQWKVISVALLMAVAGGAVAATHANANADANDGINTQPYAANQAQFQQKPASNNPQPAKPASSASVGYYPAASGSAAYYFDHVASDDAVAAKNYNTVNSYVQSLNNEYNPQVHSYATKSASASNAASNDVKLADYYNSVNANPNTAKTVNSLAAQNHMAPQVYQGMVWGQEQNYSNAVSSASDDVNANNLVNSLVNRLYGTNLSNASMSASASAVIANFNSKGALANLQSVENRYHQGAGGIMNYINAANSLSAGANELYAQGNSINYNAYINMLTTTANSSALNSDFNSDVASNVKQASANMSASNIVDYAYDHAFNLNDFVTDAQAPETNLTFDDADTADNTNPQNDFTAAVSAATDVNFSNYLASAANSLYGKYNPESVDANELSKAGSSAIQSAEDRSLAASYAYDFANANSSTLSNIIYLVNSYGNKSAAASAFLNEGVHNFEHQLGVGNYYANAATYSYGPTIIGFGPYTETLATSNGQINQTVKTLLQDKNNVTTEAIGSSDETSMSKAASSAAKALTDLTGDTAAWQNSGAGTLLSSANKDSYLSQSNASANSLSAYYVKRNSMSGFMSLFTSANNGFKSAASMAASDMALSANTGDISVASVSSAINSAATALSVAGTKATTLASSGEGLKPSAYPTTYTFKHTNAYNNWVSDALLSDGVDLTQLESASGAIDNVANAVNATYKAGNHNGAFDFDNALSTASSSANSALASAQNASATYSQANDEDVTTASYLATSYSNAGQSESAVSSTESSELNSFFVQMAQDSIFTNADNAYAGAEAAAASDKKMGEDYSAVVFNNSPHFLDVLKGAKLHSSYNFGSKGDQIVGSVNKGDRLTVYGVNFNRNGLMHGATRYLVLDNNTGKKGFFTGQPQFSKAAYLNSVLDTNNVDVSVKTLKPVNVMTDLNGGKVVKTLPANTVVDGVTIVNDNPNNDAMGFTKVETSDYNFFTANTDYVKLNTVVPKNTNNNEPNNFDFNLNNIGLGIAYNQNGQLSKYNK